VCRGSNSNWGEAARKEAFLHCKEGTHTVSFMGDTLPELFGLSLGQVTVFHERLEEGVAVDAASVRRYAWGWSRFFALPGSSGGHRFLGFEFHSKKRFRSV
jgi:hypothetical protein